MAQQDNGDPDATRRSPPSGEHLSAFYLHPEAFRYDFGHHHPLQPVRLRALVHLVEALGLFDELNEWRRPEPATYSELTLVHTPDFVNAVQYLSGAQYPLGGRDTRLAVAVGLGPGDTPAFAGMAEASGAIAGATVAAIRAVLAGDVAHGFSPSGGLHHAMPGHGSGFCIYNDVSVAIAVAVREIGARVLYLDFDAHHGDGVQAAFYDDDQVMTVSFHESGRSLFPGTGGIDERGAGRGLGYAVNMPFAPFTQDTSWLEAVDSLVPELCHDYTPDLIVSQHGADGHVWDPLTHLGLTCNAFAAQTALVHRLAHEHCDGRWVACGGGGYQPFRVVPRAWAALWAEMIARPLPERLPEIWLERWSAESEEGIPVSFQDPPDAFPAIPREAQITAENQATLRRLREPPP